FDFENSIVKHGQLLPSGDAELQFKTFAGAPGIARKMNHNNDVFPDGYFMTAPVWENFVTRGANVAYFGWRGDLKGAGVNSFGRMIANSKAFPSCMVKRVYRSVCKRDVADFESALVDSLAKDFENKNYNLKWLFERVGSDPACL